MRRVRRFSTSLNSSTTKAKGRKDSPSDPPYCYRWMVHRAGRASDDLYYYSIRLGIEKKSSELGYNIVRIFNNDSLSQLKQIDGIIAIGKFSTSSVRRSWVKYSPVSGSWTAIAPNQGHSCMTTDFWVRYPCSTIFLSRASRNAAIAGREETADGTTSLDDPRLASFLPLPSDKELYQPAYVKIGKFSSESGYQLMKDHQPAERTDAQSTLHSQMPAIGALFRAE